MPRAACAIHPLDGEGWALWNKWKVMSLTQEATASNPAVTTTYTYLTPPTWHYDDGSGEWSDYRGHHQVRVSDAVGVNTTYTFYTGMKGDPSPHIYPYPLETFTTSESGATVRQNEDWLAGQVAETLVRSSGGSKQAGTVTYYTWAETVSGKETYWSAPSRVESTNYVGSPDTTTKTSYVYYTALWNRNILNVRQYGVEGVDGIRRTKYWYVQSAVHNNWFLPRMTALYPTEGGGAAVAITSYFYDGKDSQTTPPTHGNLTRTRVRADLVPTYLDYETEYSSTCLWPVASIDPEGTSTEYVRNSTYGYVASQTVDPGGLGFTTSYTVDPARGLPKTMIDPNGSKITIEYDTHGRLVGAWTPVNHTNGVKNTDPSVEFIYSTPGSGEASVHTRVLSEVGGEPDWLHSWVYYDGFGRQAQTQVPYAVDEQTTHRTVVSTEYNNRGLVRYVSAPYEDDGLAGSGYVDPTWSSLDSYSRTDYDSLARPGTVKTYSEGVELWRTTYTRGSNWVKVTDAESRWTTSYSNGHGELSVVAEPTGAETTYTYTTRGELETVTHDYNTTTTADDITVSMVYDQAGRKTSMSDPDMGDWSYVYDDNGNLTEQEDGRDVVLGFDYDAIGRLTERSAGAQVLATYTYDNPTVDYSKGRLTATSAGGVTTSIGDYDIGGNVLSSTLSIDGSSYTTTSTYTIDGKVDTVTYPQVFDGAEFLAAETVSYTYDGVGRVFSIVGDDIYLREATYTGEGLPEHLALGPQVDIDEQLYDTASRSWSYDPDTLRVTEISAGSRRYGSTDPQANLQSLAYQYDDTGNVTSLTDNLNSEQRQCFEYNNMNQLVAAFTGNSTCTDNSGTGDQPYDRDYSYDAVGNITTKGSLDDYVYGAGDAGPHAVTSVDGVTFEYDDNGNRTSRTENSVTVEYTYDAENRLVEVSKPLADDTTFVYDADGARIKRAHGDTATYYIGPIEIETDSGDVVESHSIYGLGGGVSAVRTVASPGDDGEVTFTFGDHLGSSATIWQAGDLGDTGPGTRSAQYYYPYGEPRDTYNPALPTDHTFTGQITDGLLDDGGTGLMYYNARYYDLQVGRFAAADTIVPNPGNPQDLNRYTYVGNNPANGIDPSGHRYIETGTGRDYWGARGNGPPARAVRIFEDMANEPDILFQYLPKGCEDRAEQMAHLIADEYPDVILNKVGIARDPGEKSLVVTIITNEGPYGGPYDRPFRWRYHMAVEVEIGGETWVIDPSLFDEPVSEAQWAAVMGAEEVEVETLPTSLYTQDGARHIWSPIGPTEQKRARNRRDNAYACRAAGPSCYISDAQLDLFNAQLDLFNAQLDLFNAQEDLRAAFRY